MCPVFLELTCQGTINRAMRIGSGSSRLLVKENHSLKRPRSVYIELQFNFNYDEEVVANLFVTFLFSLHAEPKTISEYVKEMALPLLTP